MRACNVPLIRAMLARPVGRGEGRLRRGRRPSETAMLRALFRLYGKQKIAATVCLPVSIPDISLDQIIDTTARLVRTTKQTVLTKRLQKATRARKVVIYIALEYELCSVESLAQELGLAVSTIKSHYSDLKRTKNTRFAEAAIINNLIEQVERKLGLTEIWS